jgi:hypothetical protein
MSFTSIIPEPDPTHRLAAFALWLDRWHHRLANPLLWLIGGFGLLEFGLASFLGHHAPPVENIQTIIIWLEKPAMLIVTARIIRWAVLKALTCDRIDNLP